MPVRTLAQLREEVRQTSDMENATKYLDNAEVDRYVNEAIADWWDLLLEAHGQEWYLEEYSFTTVAGTIEYTIDDSDKPKFYILKGVDIEYDGERCPMAPYNLLQRNIHGTGKPCWYRLKGNVHKDTGVYTKKIRLQPEPDAAYPVYLLYVPAAPVLVDDGDVWDGHNAWEEYIVVTAAIKCLVKEESDTEQLELRREQLRQRILNIAGDRDWSTTEIVNDTLTMGPAMGGPNIGCGAMIYIGGGGGGGGGSTCCLEPADLDWKEHAAVKSTANVDIATGLAAGATIDGVVLVESDRVLLASQTDPIENGIYDVPAAGAGTRASDMPVGNNAAGAFIYINEGTTGEGTLWTCTNDDGADVVGTHGLTWAQAFISAGVTDHGALSGLPDDDHTQYLLAESSSTDNALVRWDLATGRAVQDSTVTLDDLGSLMSFLYTGGSTIRTPDSATATGPNLTLQAGAGGTGEGVIPGGHVVLTPGAAGSGGDDGAVIVAGPANEGRAIYLFERAAKPTVLTLLTNNGAIYAKDVAGTTHLFWVDSADVEHQITPPPVATTDTWSMVFGLDKVPVDSGGTYSVPSGFFPHNALSASFAHKAAGYYTIPIPKACTITRMDVRHSGVGTTGTSLKYQIAGSSMSVTLDSAAASGSTTANPVSKTAGSTVEVTVEVTSFGNTPDGIFVTLLCEAA